jgi:hypothetical protein
VGSRFARSSFVVAFVSPAFLAIILRIGILWFRLGHDSNRSWIEEVSRRYFSNNESRKREPDETCVYVCACGRQETDKTALNKYRHHCVSGSQRSVGWNLFRLNSSNVPTEQPGEIIARGDTKYLLSPL